MQRDRIPCREGARTQICKELSSNAVSQEARSQEPGWEGLSLSHVCSHRRNMALLTLDCASERLGFEPLNLGCFVKAGLPLLPHQSINHRLQLAVSRFAQPG